MKVQQLILSVDFQIKQNGFAIVEVGRHKVSPQSLKALLKRNPNLESVYGGADGVRKIRAKK